MDPIGSIKLRWLQGALQDVTYELARSQFQFAPHTWEPAINAYRCEKCVRICVDLAGVERSQIDLKRSGRCSRRSKTEFEICSGGKRR